MAQERGAFKVTSGVSANAARRQVNWKKMLTFLATDLAAATLVNLCNLHMK
jgi:hypothetical protein